MSGGDGIIISLLRLGVALHLSTHLFLTNFNLELAYDEVRVMRKLKKCLDLLVRVIQISETKFRLDYRVLHIDRISCGLKRHKRGLLFLLEMVVIRNLSK